MIVLIDNTVTAALNADHVNPLARDPKEPDDLSAFVELLHNADVQAAAAALVGRVSDLYAQHGISRVIAAAVKRAQSNGHHPTPARVEQALQDMGGEVGVLAEHVAHASRLEDRAANHLKWLRRPFVLEVGERLRQIIDRGATATGDDAKVLAVEEHELNEWLRQQWRHPDELADLSGYFAALAADPGAFDPPEVDEITNEATPAT